MHVGATEEYIFGFPSNLALSPKFTRLVVTTTSSNSEQITVSSVSRTLYSGQVTAGIATTIDIPSDLTTFTSGSADRFKGVRVNTSSPSLSLIGVNHNALTPSSASTGTFKILPYRPSAAKIYLYHAICTGSRYQSYRSEILLVAYEDNTEIEIVSPSLEILLTLPANVQEHNDSFVEKTSHAVILHRMQTLLITHSSQDLTGTLISSNKQLAVISGHECGNVPSDKDYCDHLLVQIPPTYSWGKEFLLFSMEGRDAGQNYKIVASQSGTSLSMYCKSGQNAQFVLSLNGSFHELHRGKTDHCSLVSDKPVMVALLGLGFKVDNQYGDPSMVLIPPITNYNNEGVHFQPMNASLFGDQYVVFLTTNPAHILYNSAKPRKHYWSAIKGAGSNTVGYTYTRAVSGSGVQQISLEEPGSPFAAFAYGFSQSPRHGYSYFIEEDHLSPYDGRLTYLHPLTCFWQ